MTWFNFPILNNEYWDDLLVFPIIRNLTASAGKLDYDWVYKGVKFADSTLISNKYHKADFNYQVTHDVKLDGVIRFHIHWKQDDTVNMPNWWGRWRFKQNGKAIGSWTEFKLDTNKFTGLSAGETQVTTAAEIDLTTAPGGKLCVSDMVDIELTRDTNNASGLFSGNDLVSGGVILYWGDCHVLKVRPGSRKEYEA